ncbi:unnamed protein product [Cylicocyclus nassatus]|uniref:Uncharacterized protein n=1 Tax=Cylicocyclus nassatus TaxID=53992 RepID=A0AA36GMW5_CYLNA|nr:unnamed protein product [Cylicocyclus nassatus]
MKDGCQTDQTGCGRRKFTSSASAPSTSKVTLDQLKSTNPRIVNTTLLKLKSMLRSRQSIERFMDPQSQKFSAVVDIFLQAATELANKTPESLSILKQSISIIANCCNYSISACLKMTAQRIAFTHIAVRIFESGTLAQDCKTSMARLVANMCAHKESAMCVASNPSLVDRLVLLLETDDASATQALRAIRGLIACSYIKEPLAEVMGDFTVLYWQIARLQGIDHRESRLNPAPSFRISLPAVFPSAYER